MNKKIVSLILALLLLVTSSVPTIISATAMDNRVMKVGNSEGYRGDTVNIDVVLENNPGFSTASIKIDYDAEKINLIDAKLCGEFAAGANVSYDNLPYLTFVKSNDSTDSLFLKLTFNILESAEIGNAPISIIYDSGDISNKNEDDVDFDVVPGGINIIAKPVAVTGVTLDKNTLSIKSGEKETLTANIIPNNATNENLIWKSSDESIVTVDKNGLVTGVKKGTATITVTTEDGNYSDTCTVSVACAHNVTTTYPAKPSTCVEQGNNEYTVCNDCGVIVSGSDEKLPIANHNYIEEVDDIYLKSAATCKDKAIYYKSCSVCGTKGIETFETGELNSDNHVGDTYLVNEKAATCTQNGYTGDIYCKSCDKMVSKGNVIPMGDHISDNNWVQTKAPTCTEQGLEIQKCKDCGKTIAERTIPALGHNYGEWEVTTPATCTSEGLETRTCHCGETETRTIPKSNHQVGEWIATKEPSCIDNGEKVQKCTVCGEVIKTESISANGHTPGEWEIVKEATCTDKGEKKSVCMVCGEEYTEIIPAIGHNFGEWNIIKEPTNTEKGEKERACSVCGEKEIVEIPFIEAETDPSTKDTTSEKNNQITTSEKHDNTNKNTSIKSPETGFDMNAVLIIGISVLLSLSFVIAIVFVNRKRKA